jgi:O-antigen/teichoic acid export membrane protein
MIKRRRTFIFGVSSGYASQVISIVIGIASVPIGLTYFGPVRYGIWMVITSMLAYLNATQFGIGTATSTLIAKAPQRSEQQTILSYSFALLIISSLIFLLLTLVAGKYSHSWLPIFGNIPSYLQDETIMAVLILAILFLIRLPTIPVASAFAGLQQLHFERLYSVILPALTNFIGLIAVVHLKGDLIMLAILNGLGNILIGLVSATHIFMLYKDLRPKRPEKLFSSPVTRQVIASGWRFFIVGLAAMIVLNTDNLVISYFLGPEHVSAYAVTFKLFTVAYSIYVVINLTLWPMYGKAAGENNWVWINKVYRDITTILPVLGGLVWIGGILFARDIIQLWTGPAGYGGALVVFALGGYGYTVSLNSCHTVLLGGINVVILWLGIFQAVLNLVLSLILVNPLGIGGVALGTFLAALLSDTWLTPLYVYSKTQGKVSIKWQPIIRHALCAVVPFVAVALILNGYPMKWWLDVSIKILIIILYLVISWKMMPSNVIGRIKDFIASSPLNNYAKLFTVLKKSDSI